MTTRRAMPSVLHNFLGTYTSRNSDHRGYWLFGQLPAEPQEWAWDLLVRSEAGDEAARAAHRLACRRFAEQVAKSGIDRDAIHEARLRLSRRPGSSHGWQGEHWTNGHMVQFSVSAVMDDGRVHELDRSVFVAPHDPRRERRRRRATHGDSEVVERCNDPFSAHVARVRLEAEGIKSWVADENLVAMHPLLAGAVGGIKVVVAANDVAAARAVLRRNPAVTVPSCPNCGSAKLHRHGLGRRSAFLTILLLGFPLGRSRARMRCEECQHAWRE
jgi:transposase-like protein